MDKPTVGRRLYYWPRAEERAIGESTQPFDAGVCYVHSATQVTISVCNEFGNPMPGKQYVTLYPTEADAVPGSCSWMDAQVRIAAERAAQKPAAAIADSASVAAGLSGGDLAGG